MATSPEDEARTPSGRDRESHAVSCLVDQVGTFFGGDARGAIRCLADAIHVIAEGSSEEAAREPLDWLAETVDLAGNAVAPLSGKPRATAVAAMARAIRALCVPRKEDRALVPTPDLDPDLAPGG